MRDDTVMTDEGSSKASGSELLDTNNSGIIIIIIKIFLFFYNNQIIFFIFFPILLALRNRQRQPSVQSQSTVNEQLITKINQYKRYGKSILVTFTIAIIILVLYHVRI